MRYKLALKNRFPMRHTLPALYCWDGQIYNLAFLLYHIWPMLYIVKKMKLKIKCCGQSSHHEVNECTATWW